MSKFEKKAGAEIVCAACGNTLVCRMSEYANQNNKLQWQNKDGGAHYKFIKEGEYKCIDKNGNVIPLKQKQETKKEDLNVCVHGVEIGLDCAECGKKPKPKDNDKMQILLNKVTVIERDLKNIKDMVDANLAITSETKLMLNDMVKLP